MDRRHIKDVEAHARDVRQPLLDIAEGAMAPRLSGRPGKQLVPGAEASALRVDKHLKLAGVGDGFSPVGVSIHDVDQVPADRRRSSGERCRVLGEHG